MKVIFTLFFFSVAAISLPAQETIISCNPTYVTTGQLHLLIHRFLSKLMMSGFNLSLYILMLEDFILMLSALANMHQAFGNVKNQGVYTGIKNGKIIVSNVELHEEEKDKFDRRFNILSAVNETNEALVEQTSDMCSSIDGLAVFYSKISTIGRLCRRKCFYYPSKNAKK